MNHASPAHAACMARIDDMHRDAAARRRHAGPRPARVRVATVMALLRRRDSAAQADASRDRRLAVAPASNR
jgi:hypothetical protein